jgi:hypothetical protein
MELKDIDLLLEKARRKKLDENISKVNEELEVARDKVRELKAKAHSASVEAETRGAFRANLEDKLAELETLKDAVGEEYPAARHELIERTAKADTAKEEIDELCGKLSSELRLVELNLQQIQDRQKQASVQTTIPYDRRASMESFRAECRPGVVEACDRATDSLSSLTQAVAASASFSPDRIRLRMRLIVCELQEAQSMLGEDSIGEQTIFRRTFGTLVAATKRMPCGYLPELRADGNGNNWTGLILQISTELARIEGTPVPQQQPVKEEEKEEEEAEEDLDADLCPELKTFVLGRQVALLGGVPGRDTSVRVRNWIERHDVAGLKWYGADSSTDESSKLEQSLRNGGAGVVIIFTSCINHPSQRNILQSCRQFGVPTLLCPRISISAIKQQML